MRTFLRLSIALMVVAGIYGFADFSNDLRSGTLVKYEDDSSPKVKLKKMNSVKHQVAGLTVLQSDSPEVTETPDVIDEDKIQMKYFSRGEPYIPEEELLTSIDTAENLEAAIKAVITDNK